MHPPLDADYPPARPLLNRFQTLPPYHQSDEVRLSIRSILSCMKLQSTLRTASDACIDLKVAPTSIQIDMLHRFGQDTLSKHNRPRVSWASCGGQEVASWPRYSLEHDLGKHIRISIQQLSECRLSLSLRSTPGPDEPDSQAKGK